MFKFFSWTLVFILTIVPFRLYVSIKRHPIVRQVVSSRR